jgi:type IV pilus assembly protein PilQ
MSFFKRILFALIIFVPNYIGAQDKYDQLNEKLIKMAINVPSLDENVNISVTKASIQEFLRAVANNSGLNIDVDPTLNITVINNFSDVKVRDLLVYLCRQYDLELNIIGNIFNIYKNQKNESIKPKVGKVDFDTLSNVVSIDFSNVTLNDAIREIVKSTGKNIVIAPGLNETKVSGFIQKMPFDNALEKFLYANNLLINKTSDNFYLIEQNQIDGLKDKDFGETRNRSDRKNKTHQSGGSDASLEVKAFKNDSVSIYADNASITDIIYEVADKTKSNYYIASKIDDKTSFKVAKASFADVLKLLLNGTKYSYKQVDSIYVIGEEKSPLLKESSVIKLNKRTIDKLSESIPKALKENVELIEFSDLNCFLISGSPSNVQAIKDFVSQIDQVVPVILIEVIIVDINKNFTLKTGIKAGLGESKETTKGTIYPELDVTIGSDAINKFLKNNNRLGLENLGNVSPNFYLKLSALEEQGLLNVRSTPQLSTLNGHEATLSIGNTEYYLEEQSNLVGTQNPISTSMKVYKSLNAELAIMIKPFVAGDDQITLDIEVKQSDFTTRISPTAPPASISRNFKSQIRIKNQEMVLLGGLEEKRTNDSGSGVPFLSRIPIIKWFFSSRSKEDSKSKLNIFIRPTIVN